MFLAISSASEDITDQTRYLWTTRLLLLLCISLWRHSILPKYGRWSSFDIQRSQRNKTQIVKNYLSRLRGSVIENSKTLPHVFLPSYSRPPLPWFQKAEDVVSSQRRSASRNNMRQKLSLCSDKASLNLHFYSWKSPSVRFLFVWQLPKKCIISGSRSVKFEQLTPRKLSMVYSR